MAASSNEIGRFAVTSLLISSLLTRLAVKSTQDTGLVGSAKNKAPATEIKMTTDVDDTAGFMAAARAWKSRNMSPVYTQAVVKTPNQLSEHKVQTRPSPVKEPLKSSTKVEKASSGNILAPEKSNPLVSESTREKMSTASPNTAAPNSAAPKKPANIDDTAGFMAAARALKARNVLPTAYAQTAAKTSGQQTQSSPVKESFKSSTKVEKTSSGNATADLGGVPGSKEADVKKEAITDAAAGQALNTDSAKHSNTDNGAEAKQTGFSASSENSEHSQGKETILADDREPEDQYETITYVCRDVYEPSKSPCLMN